MSLIGFGHDTSKQIERGIVALERLAESSERIERQLERLERMEAEND